MKLGLLGERLGHSMSPAIHEKAFKAMNTAGRYELIEVARENLASFMQELKEGAYDGINVTIPYKKEVMPYLDEISDSAQRIGAVNTIKRVDDKLYGFNTDYDGFGALLESVFIDVAGQDFVVLGAGGAANSVLAYLNDHKAASITLVSRSPEKAEQMVSTDVFDVPFEICGYENLTMTGKALVNTTPVGMYPKDGVSPVSKESLKGCTAVVDIIYNPSETKLMQDALSTGTPAVNGLYMLVAQALKAEEIWQNKTLDSGLVRQIYHQIDGRKQNMVIIGMPGCGKTTVGKMVANQLGMDFFDMDAYIEAHYGDIPSLFAKSEAHFRDIESEVAMIASRLENTVISTGGGVVKRKDNMSNLARTGAIFFLDRPLNQIYHDVDRETRPLFYENPLTVLKLYEERIDLYRQYAHFRIENEIDAKTAVSRIEEKWQG